MMQTQKNSTRNKLCLTNVAWLLCIGLVVCVITIVIVRVIMSDSDIPSQGEINRNGLEKLHCNPSASRLFPELQRLNTTQLILNARNNPKVPSDITFEYNRYQRNWNYFRISHYDWWMFPWKATAKDSVRSRQYSVGAGDVADLICTHNFTSRYVNGVYHLIAAQSIGKINPVLSKNVHPARYPKIYCSMKYFINIAGYIEDQQSKDMIKTAFYNFKQIFGDQNPSCVEHIDYPKRQ
eukprot:324868_1